MLKSAPGGWGTSAKATDIKSGLRGFERCESCAIWGATSGSWAEAFFIIGKGE